MTASQELPEFLAAQAAPAAPERPMLRLAPPLHEVGDQQPELDFDAFVRRYQPSLRRLVLRRIGNPSDADEITQETLLRAFKHSSSFSSEDELMAWSTVVAQRLVIDRVRVRGRSIPVAEVPETAHLGRDTAEVVVARHEALAALAALEAIPTRQAAILWSREVEGLHYDEIAVRFGITEPAVRSLLHRGRRALRREFKARTGSVPMHGLTGIAPVLIALRAAGHIRRAARTVTKSPPASALAGLSLLGATVLAISGGIVGSGPGHRLPVPPAVVAQAAGGGAIAGTAPVAGPAALRSGGGRSVVAGGTVDRRPGDPTEGLSKTACGANRVSPVQCTGGLPRGAESVTMWVGPVLPDNPTGVRRIAVSSDTVAECPATPTTPVVECTHGDDETQPSSTREAAFPGGQGIPRPPSIPSEGARR